MFWHPGTDSLIFWKCAITCSFLVLFVWNVVEKNRNVVNLLLKCCLNDVETLGNSENRKEIKYCLTPRDWYLDFLFIYSFIYLFLICHNSFILFFFCMKWWRCIHIQNRKTENLKLNSFLTHVIYIPSISFILVIWIQKDIIYHSIQWKRGSQSNWIHGKKSQQSKCKVVQGNSTIRGIGRWEGVSVCDWKGVPWQYHLS